MSSAAGRAGEVPTIALAILTVAGGYALQLRDNIPTIASPGHWALFGGSIDDLPRPIDPIVTALLERYHTTVSEAQRRE